MGATRRPATGGSRPPPPPLSEQATSQNASAPPRPIHPMHPAAQQGNQGPGIRPPHPNLGPSPVGSFDSSASRERPPAPRWMAQNNKSQDSVATSFTARSDDGSSLPPRSRNGANGPGSYGRFGEATDNRTPSVLTPPQPPPQSQSSPKSQPPSILSPPQPPQSVPSPLQLERPPPERRRPPMDPTRPQDRDLVPPPLISPNKEPMAPPPRSSERVVSRLDNSSQKSANSSYSGSVLEQPKPPPTGRLPDPPKREPLGTPAALRPGSSPSRTPVQTPTPGMGYQQGGPPRANTGSPAPAQGRMPSPSPVRDPSPAPARVPTPSQAHAPSPAMALSPGSGGGGSSDVSPMTVSVPRFANIQQPPPELPKQESPKPVDEPSPGERGAEISDRDSNPSPAISGEEKPGLGPMIKAKKSRNEIAGALWKAASAANAATAFKPRPGGAGERLRLLKSKTEEGPDGISGVVPAPPRPSEQPTPEETPVETPKTEEENKQLEEQKPAEPTKSASRMSLVPEVKITLPTSRPVSVHGPPQEVQRNQRSPRRKNRVAPLMRVTT
ncbi:hypothetical protein NXS19_014083 [Fusarium pseudograminearum]|nr:hypothetical protein NXS19_014083 [Fusarium pseudograminearum]